MLAAICRYPPDVSADYAGYWLLAAAAAAAAAAAISFREVNNSV